MHDEEGTGEGHIILVSLSRQFTLASSDIMTTHLKNGGDNIMFVSCVEGAMQLLFSSHKQGSDRSLHPMILWY